LPDWARAKESAFCATLSVVVPATVGSLAASATTCARTFACCAASAGGGGVGAGVVVGGRVTCEASTEATQAGVPVRPSAAQVAASTTPFAGTLSLRCAATTAARVRGPKAPSLLTRTACCKTRTAGPTAPTVSVVQVVATPVPCDC
jgi:hypothetical protein